MAIGAAGSAYVTGGTQYPDFPTTSGSLQIAYSGRVAAIPGLLGNAFVTKFLSSGKIAYSTYAGMWQDTAIAVDSAGEAAINAALAAAPPSNCSAPAVLSLINAAGSAIAGSSPVAARYLAWGGSGGLYAAGPTTTLVFLTTPRAFQTQ
jgi:hypothetical protein